MRTAVEALFDAMVTGGWMTKSSGDVEAPTGHFAYASYKKEEIGELYDVMSDIIDVYGRPDPEAVIGHTIVTTDSQGLMRIERFPTEWSMLAAYRELEREYEQWASS